MKIETSTVVASHVWAAILNYHSRVNGILEGYPKNAARADLEKMRDHLQWIAIQLQDEIREAVSSGRAVSLELVFTDGPHIHPGRLDLSYP